MRRFTIILLFFLISPSLSAFAQHEEEETISNCNENVNKKNIGKYEDALNLFNKKKYTECTKALKEIQETEPDYADVYFLLGMIAMKNENINAAEKNFNRVTELCQSYPNPYLYFYLGQLRYSDEKYTEAVTLFQRFFDLAQNSNNPEFEKLYEEAENYQQWSEFLGTVYTNQVPFNPQPVKGLSTRSDESFPYFTVDNAMVFLSKKIIEQSSSGSALFAEDVESSPIRFYMSQRLPDGGFDEGEILPPPFNIFPDEGFATLTADNKLLYCTRCNYENTYFNCDIYFSEYKNGEWSPFQGAGNNVNSSKTWEGQPSITPDGKWLYFASNRVGGIGGTDIWRVKRLPSGEWGRPENLGPTINTPADEKTPFIHPDGVTLYFSSNGWKGLGGYDIFYSRLENKNQKRPINIGYPINTEDNELGFMVNASGDKGYFSSTKYKNTSDLDIFEFDLYEKARPEPITLIKGNLTDENEKGTEGYISFLKLDDPETSEFKTDSETGDFTAVIRKEYDYLMIAKKTGYAYDYKLLSKNMLEKNDNLTVNLQIKPIEVGGTYQLKDIQYSTNSYDLTNDSKFIIDAFAEFLQENPTVYIVIQGHTDNVGVAKENMSLSESRAKSVYDYLISKRIRSERLEYKGYGSTQPIASNDTEEGRSKNRRTVFVIIRK